MSKTKDKTKLDVPAVTLASLGLENYVVEEIHRSELKGAEYNPRHLPDDAKKKLRAQLKKNGLVGTPTWNRRTGAIVGGHQRLAALDALAGTSNYTLKVAVIDVNEKKEKELNVALNNDASMGIWDMTKLGDIFKDSFIDVEATGFDPTDVLKLFSDPSSSSGIDTAPKLDGLKYSIVLDCRDEQHQLEALAVLEQQGYTCRPMIS